MFSTYGFTQQNLVPNPSFEEHSSCPLLNDLGDGQFTRCTDWWYPTASYVGTSDYFCACNDTVGGANQGVVGVPDNFWGTQEAYEGSCYVGFGLYDYSILNNAVVERELISTKLIEPLKACYLYELSFQISYAEKSSHGINEIQFRVTKENEYYATIDEVPQDNIYRIQLDQIDTAEWTNARYQFVASGMEQYLTIGYFTDVDTTQLFFNDSSLIYIFGSYGTYFYADSVNLKIIGEVENCLPTLPNFFSPNGDGDNDYFSIEAMEIERLQIVNRWGNGIVELDAVNPVWDGKDNSGLECLEGTYYYVGEYHGSPLNGFIQLVR